MKNLTSEYLCPPLFPHARTLKLRISRVKSPNGKSSDKRTPAGPWYSQPRCDGSRETPCPTDIDLSKEYCLAVCGQESILETHVKMYAIWPSWCRKSLSLRPVSKFKIAGGQVMLVYPWCFDFSHDYGFVLPTSLEDKIGLSQVAMIRWQGTAGVSQRKVQVLGTKSGAQNESGSPF
ncbi:uncharacterized protein BJX67DRAFT_343456 [Aspergillus lucknowensis]|uniref:Uncharacterized protein n=1 Tax=Aspergillus lucknowensis TaxID=176173 RepID=A0ABR4M395_9EURO